MNKLAIAVCIYLALGMELALRRSLDLQGLPVGPGVVFAFVTLLAAFISPGSSLTIAVFAGLLIDLTALQSFSTDQTAFTNVVIGPHALGFFIGAQLVIYLRGIFLRRNPLSLALLAILGSGAAHVVALALLLTKAWIESIAGSNMDLSPQLLTRLWAALLTGIPALLLALTWRWISPLLGLPDPFSRTSMFGRSPN
jgi:hypothetical protein